MTLYEYTLEDRGLGLTCPPWIDDGGYWMDADEKMIGVRDDSNVAAIPAGSVSFTSSELVARQLALHAVTPFTKEGVAIDNDMMTDAEVITMVQDWVTSKG
tara:strand:- start:223 stop:525 length:303 start_codon:yes stop_codon:yes gene_type:complete